MLLNAQIRKKKRKAEVKSLNFIDFLNVFVYNQKGLGKGGLSDAKSSS